MYISTTTPPMTTPMMVIKSGSSRRDAQSTQRANSSSWNFAERSSMSPSRPVFSPTFSSDCATGVAMPACSSAVENGMPSCTARRACASCSCCAGSSMGATMASALCSGMPACSSRLRAR
ncbi:hypothetical protein D3C72_1998480 [compost metagenome]